MNTATTSTTSLDKTVTPIMFVETTTRIDQRSLATAQFVLDSCGIESATAQQEQRVKPQIRRFAHDTLIVFAERRDDELDRLLADLSGFLTHAGAQLLMHVRPFIVLGFTA